MVETEDYFVLRKNNITSNLPETHKTQQVRENIDKILSDNFFVRRMIRGPVSGGTDLLTPNGKKDSFSVAWVSDNHDGSAPYTETTDYLISVDGDNLNVDWSPGGSEPTAADVYWVGFTFEEVQSDSEVEVTDVTDLVIDASVGFNPETDVRGEPSLQSGITTKWNPIFKEFKIGFNHIDDTPTSARRCNDSKIYNTVTKEVRDLIPRPLTHGFYGDGAHADSYAWYILRPDISEFQYKDDLANENKFLYDCANYTVSAPPDGGPIAFGTDYADWPIFLPGKILRLYVTVEGSNLTDLEVTVSNGRDSITDSPVTGVELEFDLVDQMVCHDLFTVRLQGIGGGTASVTSIAFRAEFYSTIALPTLEYGSQTFRFALGDHEATPDANLSVDVEYDLISVSLRTQMEIRYQQMLQTIEGLYRTKILNPNNANAHLGTDPTNYGYAWKKAFIETIVATTAEIDNLGANLNAGGNKITNLAAPTDPGDATNKDYVDFSSSKYGEHDRSVPEEVIEVGSGSIAWVTAFTAEAAPCQGVIVANWQHSCPSYHGGSTKMVIDGEDTPRSYNISTPAGTGWLDRVDAWPVEAGSTIEIQIKRSNTADPSNVKNIVFYLIPGPVSNVLMENITYLRPAPAFSYSMDGSLPGSPIGNYSFSKVGHKRYSSCASADEGDRFSCTGLSADSTSGLTSLGVMCWWSPQDFTDAHQALLVMGGVGSGARESFGIGIVGGAGSTSLRVIHTNGSGSDVPYTFEVGEWYHIYIRCDNTTYDVDCYVNGVLVDTVNIGGAINLGVNSSTIGYVQSDLSWGVRGKLSDVRYYRGYYFPAPDKDMLDEIISGFSPEHTEMVNLHSAIESRLTDLEATRLTEVAADLIYAQLVHTHTTAAITDFTSATEAIITAELADGESIDAAIDALISSHAGAADPHTGYLKESSLENPPTNVTDTAPQSAWAFAHMNNASAHWTGDQNAANKALLYLASIGINATTLPIYYGAKTTQPIAFIGYAGDSTSNRGGYIQAQSHSNQGTYIGLFKNKGALPGYPNDYYGVIKTDSATVYYATSAGYIGYRNDGLVVAQLASDLASIAIQVDATRGKVETSRNRMTFKINS